MYIKAIKITQRKKLSFSIEISFKQMILLNFFLTEKHSLRISWGGMNTFLFVSGAKKPPLQATELVYDNNCCE